MKRRTSQKMNLPLWILCKYLKILILYIFKIYKISIPFGIILWSLLSNWKYLEMLIQIWELKINIGINYQR